MRLQPVEHSLRESHQVADAGGENICRHDWKGMNHRKKQLPRPFSAQISATSVGARLDLSKLQPENSFPPLPRANNARSIFPPPNFRQKTGRKLFSSRKSAAIGQKNFFLPCANANRATHRQRAA
ncbi:MAG: hypothetical protein JO295_02390 [Verrucomicrobia bacterium]|nr:hypothetical protein [Verrucomicrobiota bacterium]